jgi:hypothetical protein
MALGERLAALEAEAAVAALHDDLPSTSVTISHRFPGQKLSKIVTAAGR